VAVVVRLFGDQHDRAVGIGEQRRGRLFADLGDLLDRFARIPGEVPDRPADGPGGTEVMLLRLVEAAPQFAHHPRTFLLLGHARGGESRQPLLFCRPFRLAVGAAVVVRASRGSGLRWWQGYRAAGRVTEQLRQSHRRNQPRLLVVGNDKGVEHELVLDPRDRQPDVHPGTQLRGVDADLSFVSGDRVRGWRHVLFFRVKPTHAGAHDSHNYRTDWRPIGSVATDHRCRSAPADARSA